MKEEKFIIFNNNMSACEVHYSTAEMHYMASEIMYGLSQ